MDRLLRIRNTKIFASISKLKNGLVVPEKLTAFTKSAAIGQILKEQMNHIVELCKNMEMEITGTEKAILLY